MEPDKTMEQRMAKIEQQVTDLKETNSLQHKDILDGLERLSCKMDAFEEESKGFVRQEEYKEDMRRITAVLEEFKKYKWQFISIASLALLLINIFGKEIIDKLLNK